MQTIGKTDASGMHCVKYHNTDVVKFNKDRIILNSGNWHTATTKARMNQTSNQFDLKYQVYQENFAWFVDFNGETLEFNDRIILKRGF